MSSVKTFFVVFLFASVLCVSASAEARDTTQGRVQMLARIDRIDEKIAVTVLKSPYTSGVHLVITGDVTVYRTADGAPLERSNLQVGDTVCIQYNGQVMMSYPPQIAAYVIERLDVKKRTKCF